MGFVQAQTPDLSLENIFAKGSFSAKGFGPARWRADGVHYTTLEQGSLVQYEALTGARMVLVSPADLTPKNAATPLDIEDYEWSPDHQKLLVFTNSARVWRLNTKGDYWVLDLKNKQLQKLGGKAPASTLMFAKFSPDGTRVAYVRQNNIYVETLKTGQIQQLTRDGSKTIINGTFDWVYEEEFSLRDGFRWSPDGQSIAYWQLDASGVRDFLLINYTDSLYSFVTPIQYPKAGQTNSAAKVGVVSAKGGATKWFPLSNDLRNHYIGRMEWADRSDALIVQHLNRLQNRNEVTLIQTKTGQKQVVYVDEDPKAWVDVVDDVLWLNRGAAFTWLTESKGWRQVLQVSRDGKTVKPVTPSGMDVISVLQIDDQNGWVYFYASPQNATERYLYRMKLDGTGRPERLTPADQMGWHSYTLAPKAGFAFHYYSTFDMPTTIDLVQLPDHKVVRTLQDNAALKAKIAALKLPKAEFFKVKNGDIEMDAWMLKPSHFDANKKYPVLFHVYGEPAGQTVTNSWKGGGGLWHRMLAEQGYLVISVDNRGTPAPKGRDWRKCIYGAVGVLASEDQAAAVREISKWPFVEASRVAVWGWSGGGSMTLNLMFRHPDLYHTGLSVAPVPDQTLYDTIYQERYMGTPQGNAEGYRKGSPITFAEGLKGNLLLMHGTGDDNVHYQGTERLVNRLVELNKPFSMMIYPNRSHGIYEGKNTTLHVYSTLTRFLNEKMPVK